jgi:hypothetical protein
MATKKNDSTDSHTDIRIGITESPQEINIECELTLDEVHQLINDTLKNDTPLVITDVRGRKTIVPAKKIAFVELGESAVRRVGFAAN